MQKNHALLELVRRLCGDQFPPAGPLLYRLFSATTRLTFDTELFPHVRVPLDMSDILHKQTYWFGRRNEYPTGWVFEAWGNDATAFFDIGSNFGFYSWWLASAFPTLPIHMFEPDPSQHLLIEQVISKNRLDSVHLYKIGLGDHSARLAFTQAADPGMSSFGRHDKLRAAGTTEVEVLTFDEFVTTNSLSLPNRPSWIAKIDVEGFDYKVLRGMDDALTRRAFKGIAVEAVDEYLEPNGGSIAQIRSFLAKRGYVEHIPKRSHRWAGASACENLFFAPAA